MTPTRRRRASSLSPRRHLPTASSSSTSSLALDELRCAICFDMLSFPVTLPCGHNFDRGCLLTAWEHEPVGASSSAHHACPLCRRPLALESDLEVNLLLKKLIAAQFPLEMAVLEREPTKRLVTTLDAAPTAAAMAPSERRGRTWRTAASFFYVWLASVTEPPGFVLAVLLLLSLLALAVTPQQVLTNASTLPTLFEAMDHVINALLLLVREIGARTDGLDLAAWRVLDVLAFLI